MTRRRAAAWCLAAYLLVALVLVLRPLPGLGVGLWHRLLLALARLVPGTPYLPSYGHAEVLGNIALFVPLGLLLPVLLPERRLRDVVVGLVLVSALVELVQLLLLPARVPSLRDVAANGLGALLGVGLAAVALGVVEHGQHGQRGR